MVVAPAMSMTASSLKVSQQTTKAAKAAAASPHALVNLIRLVKALENEDAGEDETPAVNSTDESAVVQSWRNTQYARVLLDTLRHGNEQSSTTSHTLSDLDKTLSTVESHFKRILSQNPASSSTISSIPSPFFAHPPSVPSQEPHTSTSRTLIVPADPSTVASPAGSQTQPPIRRRAIPAKYLQSRQSEDRQGGEIGLLPLKNVHRAKSISDRDKLLAGGGVGTGMGATQIHEELGEQLVDMSHRLRMNAVHFANSLENEKNMLEHSSETLEKNLAGTRSSKSNLAVVSKKGKGTTCLTLGVVVVTLVLFVWTYLLIRFT